MTGTYDIYITNGNTAAGDVLENLTPSPVLRAELLGGARLGGVHE